MFFQLNLRTYNFPELVRNFRHFSYAFVQKGKIYIALLLEIVIKQCDCEISNLKKLYAHNSKYYN